MGKSRDVLLWCLHCERVSFESEWKENGDGWRECPYPGCDGGLLGDGADYHANRRGKLGTFGYPDGMLHWPEEPKRGVVYPLDP